MSKVKLESIRIEIFNQESKVINLDWSNDRHQSIKIGDGKPERVIDTLKLLIIDLKQEIKEGLLREGF